MAPKGRKGKGTAATLREKVGKSYTAEELQKAQEQLKNASAAQYASHQAAFTQWCKRMNIADWQKRGDERRDDMAVYMLYQMDKKGSKSTTVSSHTKESSSSQKKKNGADVGRGDGQSSRTHQGPGMARRR